MLPPSASFSIALGALFTLASVASGAVPSPATSTVDPCINVCPAGDMTFHVVVRDLASNPVTGSSVVVDFCNCPGVILCPSGGGGGGGGLNGVCLATMVANAAGVADFNIRAGGVCSGGPVTIYADGVILAQRSVVASPDQNGDASVDPADQAILAAKLLGPYDPTGDFNCSAALEDGDTGIEARHVGHSCGAVVPVAPGSWGRIKIVYR
jgi:hypothetical protein